MKKILQKPVFVQDIVDIFRRNLPSDELLDLLSEYHEKDIADALELLSEDERKKLYPLLGDDYISEIMSYVDNPETYIAEMDLKNAANVLSEMDSDDAADVLEEMDSDSRKEMTSILDDETRTRLQLMLSYNDNEIGSRIDTNFIVIEKDISIREATSELIRQAGEHDNISTIYVVDKKQKYYGAITLNDLIIARKEDSLDSIISTSYPFVYDHEEISDCIEILKDYAEDSIPVLSEHNHILGVITSQDLIEVVDDEMGDDYAKLAGLKSEEDLNERTGESMKKRLPWLVALLFLGMLVSSLVGMFETVVAMMPLVICFQSLILDMAGNVGTQSLAVTIRVLMDDELKAKKKASFVFKEMKVGLCNGLFLGVLSFGFITLYTYYFKKTTIHMALAIAFCVGSSLVVSIVISSLVGTLIPMFFDKIKVDPAVASGPLITTVNDMVAVVTYYSLTWFLLTEVVHIM